MHNLFQYIILYSFVGTLTKVVKCTIYHHHSTSSYINFIILVYQLPNIRKFNVTTNTSYTNKRLTIFISSQFKTGNMNHVMNLQFLFAFNHILETSDYYTWDFEGGE